MLWSVTFPLWALAQFVLAILLSMVRQLKECVMKKLHEIMSFGVALLLVPGRIGESQFG